MLSGAGLLPAILSWFAKPPPGSRPAPSSGWLGAEAGRTAPWPRRCATTGRAPWRSRICGPRGYDRSMKQHTGAEIRTIMTEMPAERIAALQAAHAEHAITEHEARWWGYLQFARTGAYDGETFVILAPSTGEEVVQRFLPYVLA